MYMYWYLKYTKLRDSLKKKKKQRGSLAGFHLVHQPAQKL